MPNATIRHASSCIACFCVAPSRSRDCAGFAGLLAVLLLTMHAGGQTERNPAHTLRAQNMCRMPAITPS